MTNETNDTHDTDDLRQLKYFAKYYIDISLENTECIIGNLFLKFIIWRMRTIALPAYVRNTYRRNLILGKSCGINII